MLHWNHNYVSTSYLTLNEKCDNKLEKNFFFLIISKDTNAKYFIAVDDISPQPEAYNQFETTSIAADVICGDYSENLNGQYTAPAGEYTYFVYQSDDNTVFDIASSHQVEQGILYIKSEKIETKTADINTIEDKVFNSEKIKIMD